MFFMFLLEKRQEFSRITRVFDIGFYLIVHMNQLNTLKVEQPFFQGFIDWFLLMTSLRASHICKQLKGGRSAIAVTFIFYLIYFILFFLLLRIIRGIIIV